MCWTMHEQYAKPGDSVPVLTWLINVRECVKVPTCQRIHSNARFNAWFNARDKGHCGASNWTQATMNSHAGSGAAYTGSRRRPAKATMHIFWIGPGRTKYTVVTEHLWAYSFFVPQLDTKFKISSNFSMVFSVRIIETITVNHVWLPYTTEAGHGGNPDSSHK
jgi:hypothetical protein